MKRYKIGVIGAPSILGRNILKKIIDFNIPYSFIRAISYNDEQKEIKVDDYQFSLAKLSIDSIKDLDIIFTVLSHFDIEEYLKYINDNNKYLIIIRDLSTSNQEFDKVISLEEVNENTNSFVCPLSFPLVIEKIIKNQNISSIELFGLHSSCEYSELGLKELSQQFIDYFNYKPLIANVFPSDLGKKIPLAFNIIPLNMINKESYDLLFKEELYRLINLDFDISSCDFYIPSFYGCAMQIKIKSPNVDELVASLKNNTNLTIYDDMYPTILDSEGNNKIQIGNLKINDDTLCFFATFDPMKIVSEYAIKIVEKRINYDKV